MNVNVREKRLKLVDSPRKTGFEVFQIPTKISNDSVPHRRLFMPQCPRLSENGTFGWPLYDNSVNAAQKV